MTGLLALPSLGATATLWRKASPRSGELRADRGGHEDVVAGCSTRHLDATPKDGWRAAPRLKPGHRLVIADSAGGTRLAEALRRVRSEQLVEDQGMPRQECHASEEGDPMFPLCPARVAREAKQPVQAPGLPGTAPVAAGSSVPEVATFGCEAGGSAHPLEDPGFRPRHEGHSVFPLCPARVAREAKQPVQAPGLLWTAPVAAGSSAPEVATSGCEVGGSAHPLEDPGFRPRHEGHSVFPLCPARVTCEAKQPVQAPGLPGTAPVAAGSSAPEVEASGREAGSSALPHEAPGARLRHEDAGPRPTHEAAGSPAHSTAAGSPRADAADGRHGPPQKDAGSPAHNTAAGSPRADAADGRYGPPQKDAGSPAHSTARDNSCANAAGGRGPPQQAACSPAQTAPAVKSAANPAAFPEGEVQTQTRAKRLPPLDNDGAASSSQEPAALRPAVEAQGADRAKAVLNCLDQASGAVFPALPPAKGGGRLRLQRGAGRLGVHWQDSRDAALEARGGLHRTGGPGPRSFRGLRNRHAGWLVSSLTT